MFWSYMEATGNSDCSVLRSFPEEGSCLAGTSVTRLLGWSSECGACGSHSPALPASVSRLHSPFLPGPAVPPAIYLLQFSPTHFSASLRSVQLVVSNFCDHTLCTCVHLFPRNWMRTDDPSQPGKEVQVHCPTPGPLNSDMLLTLMHTLSPLPATSHLVTVFLQSWLNMPSASQVLARADLSMTLPRAHCPVSTYRWKLSLRELKELSRC